MFKLKGDGDLGWAEKENLASTKLHSIPDDPPTYKTAQNGHNAVDPMPGFASLNLFGHTPKPTEDHCLAHLKLLEAFNQLREDVSTNDGLYGLHNSLVKCELSEAQRKVALAKMREKRWAVFVGVAAERFAVWWKSLNPQAKMLQQHELSLKSYGNTSVSGEVREFSRDNIPPLGMLPHISLKHLLMTY
jgi:hypothetical protein